MARRGMGMLEERRERSWWGDLQGWIAGWCGTLLILFLGLKLSAILWFAVHGVDPFGDLPAWRIPLLVGADLFAAGTLGTVLGLLHWGTGARPAVARPATALLVLVATAIVIQSAVNMKVVEIY